MRKTSLVVILVLAVLPLAACKHRYTACTQDNKDYAGAQEMPPLKAPPGLDAPDTRNALRVPPLDAPERIRAKDEPCLDAPPPFSNPKGPAAPKTG